MTVPDVTGARVRERRSGRAWHVRVDRVVDLARLIPCAVGAARLVEVDVEVARWWAPQTTWVGAPRVASLVRCDIDAGDGTARVRLRVASPTDAGALLAGALRCLQPRPTGDVGAALTFAPGLDESARPWAARVVDVVVDDEERDRHVRRADVLVVGAATAPPDVERAATVTIGVGGWSRDAMAFDVDVDPAVHRPLGRRSTGGRVVAARAEGDRLVAEVDGTAVAIDIHAGVQPADVRGLRGVRALMCDREPSDRIRRQLEACGVVVATDSAGLPEDVDGLEADLAWQDLSVRTRRHALRAFGPTRVLDEWPTVSAILVTHRSEHLVSAFAQLAGLEYPRLEIVVGAHGTGVDPALVWQLAQEVPYPCTVVAVDGGRTLGEALQQCCDSASGALVTKVDDDDVYAPQHIWDLVLAREYSGAQVVGKSLDWIHLSAHDTTVFRPTYPAERYADFVCGGTILISRADLLAVGGWRPVPKSVDRALLDRVLADGGLVYRTHGLGYVYVRHGSGHTASVADEHFLTRIEGRVDGLIAHAAFGTQAA